MREGIPTTYKGIRFRSRLEATWAAFFDAVGWEGKWQYEPLDFNGYIPDFVLRFKTPLFVEIKPALTKTDLEPAVTKAIASGCPNILCLMAFPVDSDYWCDGKDIGLIQDDHSCSNDVAVLMECNQCGTMSIISHYGGWKCRVCDAYDGDHHLGGLRGSFIDQSWANAKNATQWKRA